jgi:hypothetical protein
MPVKSMKVIRSALDRVVMTSDSEGILPDEITVSAPNERVDLEALKATKARRKGAER